MVKMNTWKVTNRVLKTCAYRSNRRLLTSDAKSDKRLRVTLDEIFSPANIERCKDTLLKRHKMNTTFQHLGKKETKRAAVLVPLCTVNGEPSVIFTLRSNFLSNHGAEVSFPGGMVSDSDTDLVHTAVRETEEEIGLDPKVISIWGKHYPIFGKNLETLVTPIIGYCGEVDLSLLEINHDEVAEVFPISIESLCTPEKIKYTRFRSSTFGSYTLPVFVGGKYRIWGLTAIILHLTLSILSPGLYTFENMHFGKRL